MRRWFVPALAVATAVSSIAACTGGRDASGPAPVGVDAGEEGGAAADSRYSFSPQRADRTCTEDADCVVLPALRECYRCCGLGAVARGEAQRAYAAAVEACQEPGAPRSSQCEMGCEAGRAACFERTCVMLPTSRGATEPSCGVEEGLGEAGVAELGPGPSCGARALRTGFEDGIDPSWTSTDPAAFSVDRSAPLSGAASLRIAYRQKDATLTIPQPDACGLRLAFTVRTRLLTTGLTLARIVAGDGAWFHVRLDACRLSIAEETRSGGAAGLSVGGATWTVPEDTPVRVVVTVDLRGRTITSAAAPVGAPLPTPVSTPLRADPAIAPGIRAVELGGAPGIQSSAVGSVWLDDLVID